MTTMSNTYMRLYSTAEVNALVKEAKRVKYLVNKVRVFSRSFVDTITVLDDEDNALVFEALRWDRHNWQVMFSKTYWQSAEDAALAAK